MQSKHHICLLNDSFPPVIDGVANTVVNYAAQIEAKHGHAVVVTPSYPDVDDSIHPFPVFRYPSIDTTRFVGYRAGYPFSPETLRKLRLENVELMHTHCPFMSMLLARSLRHKLDVPIVLTYHTKFDVEIAKATRRKLLQEGAVRALVQNIAAADEVWVVSHGAGENLRGLGYEGEYVVMENGVDMPYGPIAETEVEAMLTGYDLPHGIPLFLFVGRMMWYKGLRIILDAMAQLHRRGIDYRMAIIGGGAEAEEMRTYAEELGIGRKCLFVGPILNRELLRAWYCRADLFLFPSTYDTNGLVVREAAACGLASVLVQNSCASEGVSDGVNGFLIEENADSMAQLLLRIYDKPSLLREVGRNALRDLYISWESSVDRACERYAYILERYRRGEYRHRHKPIDELLRTQGGLMSAFAHVSGIGHEIGRIGGGAQQRIARIGGGAQQRIARIGDGAQRRIGEAKDRLQRLKLHKDEK